MRYAIWPVVFAALLFHPVLAANNVAIVGDVGNPPELVIEGAKTFGPDEVSRALLADLDVANAMHPTAPLNELLHLLVTKTQDGYRDEGFPDVSVRPRHGPAHQIVLAIDEGPRYLASEIQVLGAKTIAAQWLREQLTPDELAKRDRHHKSGAQSLAHAKHWPLGKPAWFSSDAIDGFRRYVRNLLFYQGRASATFTVQVVRDENTRTAALRITIDDEGPPAVVGSIRVSGNKKNSVPDILAFLGIHEGMPYRGGLEDELRQRLSRSARFLKSTIKLRWLATPGGALALTIDMLEYEKAPPLRQPLSREEAVLASLGNWLSRFHESDEEIAFQLSHAKLNIEFVIAPRLGAEIIARPLSAGDVERPFAFAFVMTDDVMGLYSAKQQRKIEAALSPSRLTGDLQLTLHCAPPNPDGDHRLAFGWEMKSSTPKRRYCAVAFKDTPLAMLSMAHEHRTMFSWENGVLVAKFTENEVRIDTESGRLVEWRVEFPNGVVGQIKPCPGRFAQRMNEINALAARWPNDADTTRPLACAMEFLCEDILAWTRRPAGGQRGANTPVVTPRDLIQVLFKASRLGVFAPLERCLAAASRASDDGFSLPTLKSGEWAEILAGDPRRGAIRACARLAIGLSDDIAPRGSWLRTAWREGAFLAAGKQDHLHYELDRLCASREAGPLRFLTVSVLLRSLGQHEAAVRCGEEGTKRLGVEQFRADYAPLLDPSKFLGDCLLNTARVLSQLDESDVEILCQAAVQAKIVPEAGAEQFAAYIKQLRERRGQPLPVAVSAVLDNCWEDGLNERVRTALLDNAGAARTARAHRPQPPQALQEGSSRGR